MEQFIAVALAHFVALLVPGVGFFLIARAAMTSGWRVATGACLGIATANGIFIAAAFSGLSFISHPGVLGVLQLAGGLFLLRIGVSFIRSDTHLGPREDPRSVQVNWCGNLGLGLASGLLNPKNALFYLSLAASVPAATPLVRVAYGSWMFAVVLLWDVFVAVALSSPRAHARLAPAIPWLTRGSGGILVLFGLGMVITTGLRVLA